MVITDDGIGGADADGEGLAGAISQVLAGGSDITELVERGRRRSRGFTWNACAEGLAELYREAVGGVSGNGPPPVGRGG